MSGVLWIGIISRPRAYREHAKRSASYISNTLNRPLNLMTGCTHNAHRQGHVGTTVKATTVQDRYGKPVNYAHFQGKRKQGHWSGHAPKIPAIFYSCPQINSSWESVHSDKSARCFAPEFLCLADSFVFICVEIQAGNQFILINQRGVLNRSFCVLPIHLSLYVLKLKQGISSF